MTCRNYHVFYYLLMGASRDEQEEFHLLKPQDYYYLNQVPLIYCQIFHSCHHMFCTAVP